MFLKACGTYTSHTASDGTKYTEYKLLKSTADFNQCTMSNWWYVTAMSSTRDIPIQAIADCYVQKKEVYELCIEWDYVYDEYYERSDGVIILRKAISKALIAKNEDPLKCRNPNNDGKVKLEKELKKAKAKAAAAEAKTVYVEPTCWYETYTNINGALASRKVCK